MSQGSCSFSCSLCNLFRGVAAKVSDMSDIPSVPVTRLTMVSSVSTALHLRGHKPWEYKIDRFTSLYPLHENISKRSLPTVSASVPPRLERRNDVCDQWNNVAIGLHEPECESNSRRIDRQALETSQREYNERRQDTSLCLSCSSRDEGEYHLSEWYF